MMYLQSFPCSFNASSDLHGGEGRGGGRRQRVPGADAVQNRGAGGRDGADPHVRRPAQLRLVIRQLLRHKMK